MTGTDVLIVTDGGHDSGIGHLRRSGEVARVLAARGVPVRTVALSSAGASLAEVEVFRPAMLRGAAVVVADVPRPMDEELSEARSGGAALFGLDYPGVVELDDGACLWRSPDRPNDHRVRIGLEYAIVRPSLLELPDPGTRAGVLLTLGGSDVQARSMDVAEQLLASGERPTVVLGRFATKREIDGVAVVTDATIEIMNVLQRACRWGVTNGGTTLLEFLSIGRAVHVLPQTRAEAQFVKAAIPAAAILGVGEPVSAPDDDVLASVETAAAATVDGSGVHRVADLILGLT